MKIFITGVAGFLGSNLADFFIKKNFEVIGCDNLVGGDIKNVNKKVKFYKANCEDLKLMSKIIHGSSILIHAAAYAHESLSIFSPYTICSNNVSGSTSVFSAAIANKIKRIIYCSSIARYGSARQPYVEDDEPVPLDPYGISKLASEKILQSLCKVHNIEYNIAVPHNIIGPKQKYDDPFRNVVSIMINLMMQNRSPIIYGDGEQKRSFTDVDDCSYSLYKMATDKNIKSEIINIGPGEENYISINDLFKIISNKLKFNKMPIYYSARPLEVKFSSCSSKKAKKLLDFKMKRNLDQTIDRTINYIKKNGVKKFKYSYPIEIINKNTPEVWKKKIF